MTEDRTRYNVQIWKFLREEVDVPRRKTDKYELLFSNLFSECILIKVHRCIWTLPNLSSSFLSYVICILSYYWVFPFIIKIVILYVCEINKINILCYICLLLHAAIVINYNALARRLTLSYSCM
jgi:hypothetical protein